MTNWRRPAYGIVWTSSFTALLAGFVPVQAGEWEVQTENRAGYNVATGLSKKTQENTSDVVSAWTGYPYGNSISYGNVVKLAASALVEGEVRAILRWRPNGWTVGSPPPTAAQLAQDPPPRLVSLVLSATAEAEAAGTVGEVVANASALGQSAEVQVLGQSWKKARVVVTKRLDPIVTNGQSYIETGWYNLKAYSSIPTNRTKPQTSGSYTYHAGVGGGGHALVSFAVLPDKITFVSPDPNGLAVDDCSGSHKTLNQYLITQRIPCVISYGGFDTAFQQQLIQSADWVLKTPPLPLLVRGPNGTNCDSAGTNIFATSFPPSEPSPPPSPAPMAGIGFDRRMGLPASNAAFGRNTITHKVLGVEVPAPIAIFYDATGKDHPPGGDFVCSGGIHGLSDNSNPTPNWFYYYKKASSSLPCAVTYVDSDSSYFDWPQAPGGIDSYKANHIHIGNQAYKLWTTDLFAKIPSGLKRVGWEQVMGIDTFARHVAHENAHRLCYEAIHNGGLADSDNDRVPDDWEGPVGLKVGSKDSIGYGAHLASFETYDETKGDSEVFARMHEKGVFGDVEQDWANTGLNYGPAPGAPPNRCKRSAPVYESQYGSASSWTWSQMPSSSSTPVH